MRIPNCRRHKNLGALFGFALVAASSIGADGAEGIGHEHLGAYDTPPQFLARAATLDSHDFAGVNWQSPAADRLFHTHSLTYTRSSRQPTSAQRVLLQAVAEGVVSTSMPISSDAILQSPMSGIGQQPADAWFPDIGLGVKSRSGTRASKSDAEAPGRRTERAISVPPALWLFGCALVGLAGVGRIRRSR